MATIYIETPISDPPKEEGRYIVTNGWGWFEVGYYKEYGFAEEFTDCSGLTHWLRPVDDGGCKIEAGLYGYVCFIDNEQVFVVAENIADCMDKLKEISNGKSYKIDIHKSIMVI